MTICQTAAHSVIRLLLHITSLSNRAGPHWPDLSWFCHSFYISSCVYLLKLFFLLMYTMVFDTRFVTGLCCMCWLCFGVVQPWYEEEEKPSFLTANVGEHVVFNCELDFPQDIPISYILKWNKDVRMKYWILLTNVCICL